MFHDSVPASDRVSVPCCSVVICTRDRPDELERCIATVLSQDYPRFEVLVVDNAPHDGRVREVAQRCRVRYTLEPVAGLSRARNRGARESGGEIIAYIDDDATAAPGWLSALAAEFADPMVMAVAGRILAPHGEKVAPPPGSDPALSRRVVDRGIPDWFEIANFGGIGIGANMALRRSAFGRWPGFDERLGRGAVLYAGEDNYAFYCLTKLGYRVVYSPAAAVYHVRLEDRVADREHRSALLTGAVGYMMFLFKEEPSGRLALLRFLLGCVVRRARRPWRPAHPPGQVRFSQRSLELEAALRGLMLYARAAFGRGLASEKMTRRGLLRSVD